MRIGFPSLYPKMAPPSFAVGGLPGLNCRVWAWHNVLAGGRPTGIAFAAVVLIQPWPPSLSYILLATDQFLDATTLRAETKQRLKESVCITAQELVDRGEPCLDPCLRTAVKFLEVSSLIWESGGEGSSDSSGSSDN